MKIAPPIFLLCAAIGVAPFIPTPCAGATHDNLPSGAPKGYVEFYPSGASGVGNAVGGEDTWDVWKEENGKLKRVTESLNAGAGFIGVLINRHRHRRIAESPGTHIYFIELGKAVQKVSVDVKEGFVTPVRVVIEKKGHAHMGLFGWRYDFVLSAYVEKPVPARE